MTRNLNLAPHIERAIAVKAQRKGMNVDNYLLHLVEEDAQRKTPIEELAATMTDEERQNVTAKLAALGSVGAYKTREGMPPLDFSGDRSDIYGYTAHEEISQ